jgi:hypothetical protein
MSQLPLFSLASETVLVDDARGRIVYTPDFVPAEVARGWFDEVRSAVAWEALRRRMPVGPRISLAFRVRPPDPSTL